VKHMAKRGGAAVNVSVIVVLHTIFPPINPRRGLSAVLCGRQAISSLLSGTQSFTSLPGWISCHFITRFVPAQTGKAEQQTHAMDSSGHSAIRPVLTRQKRVHIERSSPIKKRTKSAPKSKKASKRVKRRRADEEGDGDTDEEDSDDDDDEDDDEEEDDEEGEGEGRDEEMREGVSDSEEDEEEEEGVAVFGRGGKRGAKVSVLLDTIPA
jgi:hypothetical protein